MHFSTWPTTYPFDLHMNPTSKHPRQQMYTSELYNHLKPIQTLWVLMDLTISSPFLCDRDFRKFCPLLQRHIVRLELHEMCRQLYRDTSHQQTRIQMQVRNQFIFKKKVW